MFATIRRYEATDQNATTELIKQVNETLLPQLSKLEGFRSYSLVDTGKGVVSSVGVFDTAAQCDESTRLASNWVREHKLEKTLPNEPKITNGEIVAHKGREFAAV
jgi:hypothetical protein